MRKSKLKFNFLIFLILIGSLVLSKRVIAQETPGELSIKPKDLAQMSQMVRNLIEENKDLSLNNQELEEELESLKEKQSTIESRLKEENQEKEQLILRLKQAEGEKDKSNQEIKSLEDNLKSLQEMKIEYDQKIKQLEEELVKKEAAVQESREQPTQTPSLISNETITPPQPRSINYETLDLLAKIDLSVQKESQFKKDAAKVRYNSANDYVKKGNYTLAIEEYKESLKLDPNDPDTHYNLAFVYDQHIKDAKAALFYYQKYLELFPQASDREAIEKRVGQLRAVKK